MSFNMLNTVSTTNNNFLSSSSELEISQGENADTGMFNSIINSTNLVSNLMSGIMKEANISSIQNPRILNKLEEKLHKFDIDSQIFSKVIGEGAKIINELTKIQ